MSTSRTRIARFTASAALVLGLGALGAGPALAGGIISPASSDSAVTWGDSQLDKARSEDGATAIIILAHEDSATPDLAWQAGTDGYWLV